MKRLRYFQYIAFATGAALLLFWGAAHVHRAVSKRSDLQRFEQARKEHSERQPTTWSLWCGARRKEPSQLHLNR